MSLQESGRLDISVPTTHFVAVALQCGGWVWSFFIALTIPHVSPLKSWCAYSFRACRGPSALDHLAAKLTVSMMTLGDVATATFGEGASNAAASAGSAVQSATDAAASTVTSKDNGWFGFLTGPLETVLKVCLVFQAYCAVSRDAPLLH